MMENSQSIVAETFKSLYGQLYSSLLNRFGTPWMDEIEDAIQNAFLKALKSWKPDRLPANKANWLFVVAKNDLINQIQRSKKELHIEIYEDDFQLVEDDRLHLILLISSYQEIHFHSRLYFIMKNIFGLSVKEISTFTLQSEESIYKNLARTKDAIYNKLKIGFDGIVNHINKSIISQSEEILYAVFNIAFDSFNPKIKSTINDDLCFDVLALLKNLIVVSDKSSTRNLLAWCCLHLSRIPAKIQDGRLISFFKQDKKLWNQSLLQLGISYLTKSDTPDKFYFEALIVSKHMTSKNLDENHWNEIIDLYNILLHFGKSPFILLNLSYCLHKAKRYEESINILSLVEKELPDGHIYLSMTKLHVYQNLTDTAREKLLKDVLEQVEQQLRYELILSYRDHDV